MSTLLSVVPLAVVAERHFEYAQGDDEAYTFQEVRKDPNQFLLEMPRGSYTGMRTIERTSVMDLSGHISRLSRSLSLIHVVPTDQILSVPPVTSPKPVPEENAHLEEPGEIAAAFAQFRDPKKLESLLVPLLKKGLERYYAVEEGPDGMEPRSGQETKVTVLIGWESKAGKREMAWNRKIRMMVHFCPLHEPPENRCQVEIHGDPRTTASAKDSQWVRDRQSLEDSKDPESNEVVLTDANTHDVYEGMSSNFFAVVPGSLLSPGRSGSVVVSAPLHAVLEGTILKLVVAACEKLKIPFEWRFPNVRDVEHWEGAFISSTSRLVLPIERIRFRDDKRQVLLPKQCGVIDDIRRQVVLGLKEKAYRIL